MLPAFLTTPVPFEPPDSVILSEPSMKAVGSMSRVVASSAPVFTTAPLPNTTPCGLTMKTWPLAVSVPRICVEPVMPTTRLSAMAELEGCTNCTLLPAPMLKLCQLIAARCVLWLMTIWLAVGLAMVAAPPTTWPPCGSFWPKATGADSIVPASSAARSDRPSGIDCSSCKSGAAEEACADRLLRRGICKDNECKRTCRRGMVRTSWRARPGTGSWRRDG